MPKLMRPRRHFIVKHGLDAFEALPNYIWNISESENKQPHRYGEVQPGDRWVGFAYTSDDYKKEIIIYGEIEILRRHQRQQALEIAEWPIRVTDPGKASRFI